MKNNTGKALKNANNEEQAKEGNMVKKTPTPNPERQKQVQSIQHCGARQNRTTKWEKTVSNSFKQMKIQKQILGFATKMSAVTLARTFCCSSQNVVLVK